MAEKRKLEEREKLKEELLEKLEKLKEEVRKSGEKTASELEKTIGEIGKDLEYLSKDFAEFFKETFEKPQVKEAIARTRSWLTSALKNAADSLLRYGKELDGLYDAGDLPAGKYECIRCGRVVEHKGGKLTGCPTCGGTTFKKID